MDSRNKRKYITDFFDRVKDEMLTLLNEGKIPEEWDGHELRELIIKKFEDQRSRVMRDKRSKRYQNFKNQIIIYNL